MKKFYFAMLAMILATTAFNAAAVEIFFENTNNWETVKVHYWGTSETGWPGVEMTKVEGTDNVYTYDLPEGTSGMIFNGNGQQTVDIFDIVAGHIYTLSDMKDGKYTATHKEYEGNGGNGGNEGDEETFPELYLRGSHFDNFQGVSDDYKFTFDKASRTYTLHLDKYGSYDSFKIANSDWSYEFTAGGEVAVNSDWVPVYKTEANTTISATLLNVTFTVLYTNAADVKLKVEGEIEPEDTEDPVEKVFSVYFENTQNWENVYTWIWVEGGENLFAEWPGQQITSTVTIDGKEYYAYSFKHNVTSKTVIKVIFNGGKDQPQTGNLTLVNKGIYNANGEQTETHNGAGIVSIESLTEGVIIDPATGSISGEYEGSLKIKVTALEHHTVYYSFASASAAAMAPAREGAEPTAVGEDGIIELPENSGNLTLYTHDGEALSQPLSLEVKNTTGIEGITIGGDNTEAEYFNLQGVRVANPTEGLYIVRRGNTVTKQYIR